MGVKAPQPPPEGRGRPMTPPPPPPKKAKPFFRRITHHEVMSGATYGSVATIAFVCGEFGTMYVNLNGPSMVVEESSPVFPRISGMIL